MKVKEGSEKVGLKVNIHKTKIMVFSPNTSRQIHGKIMETVRDFNSGALKSLQIVTAPMKFKDTCSSDSSIALTSHTSKVMLKILQASFSNMWTMNLRMFKLVLEKAEGPEIKLATYAGSLEKQDFQKNIHFCFIEYAKAFDSVDHNKLWKTMKEMGIPHHLICLLRNLYADQEATVRTGHGTTDWFQIGKWIRQAVYCHPAYLNYMQSTSWEMLG